MGLWRRITSMFGFGKQDPALAQLISLNARVNGARQWGSKLQPGDLDQDDQTVYDCDNFTHDKLFAKDWPTDARGNAIPAQPYDVDLPPVRGQPVGKHRVLVATVNGTDYVLDNMTNALLTREDREKAGWVFSPYKPGPLNMQAPNQTAALPSSSPGRGQN